MKTEKIMIPVSDKQKLDFLLDAARKIVAARLPADYPNSPNDTLSKAIANFDEAPAPQYEYVIDEKFAEFLLGRGPLEDVWFGDALPSGIGRWWWRDRLALCKSFKRKPTT